MSEISLGTESYPKRYGGKLPHPSAARVVSVPPFLELGKLLKIASSEFEGGKKPRRRI
jgi:hypothetical protein